jgi:mRNA-degrading endonuclease RelE of RelBE toxin-antitoxin system
MMAPDEIVFQPSVEKDLHKLPVENCDRIMVRLEALASEPFPAQVVKWRRDNAIDP